MEIFFGGFLEDNDGFFFQPVQESNFFPALHLFREGLPCTHNPNDFELWDPLEG